MSASRYNKSDVLEAALKLLDELGLPDLTMRKLAASLDVQPSALYWHYPNKQTLLAEVSNTIVAFMKPVAEAETWQLTTKLKALALRDALLAFRDGAEVVSSTLRLGWAPPPRWSEFKPPSKSPTKPSLTQRQNQ